MGRRDPRDPKDSECPSGDQTLVLANAAPVRSHSLTKATGSLPTSRSHLALFHHHHRTTSSFHHTCVRSFVLSPFAHTLIVSHSWPSTIPLNVHQKR
uniref:Uncharacterized protein n=1 Tax=Anguilla anguilla TaxID=7936 RepID=A0A0E9X5E3_ANGAN